MRSILSWLIDRRLAAYQGDLAQKHFDAVQSIYRQMRGWRHNYHNHIQIMKAHISLGQVSELEAYLDKLDADLTSVDSIIKSGNLMLDAVLNSKLSLAGEKKISVTAKATAPETMNVSDIDLCVVVGNLLDNAIEACLRLKDEDARFIRVYIGLLKGQFYVSVSNSMGTDVKKQGTRYLTTKNSSHGFGLQSVDRVVRKYGGYVNRQNEDCIFATEIMLPI
ncbi:MAG: ATP-binding protein [Oscillospiraceae bacterium]|nr:ATP-binding protein [Oscillospiraceae bacterium]MCL2278514.1 ATP-binding protein [Oscillospiraceae bacterium]